MTRLPLQLRVSAFLLLTPLYFLLWGCSWVVCPLKTRRFWLRDTWACALVNAAQQAIRQRNYPPEVLIAALTPYTPSNTVLFYSCGIVQLVDIERVANT